MEQKQKNKKEKKPWSKKKKIIVRILTGIAILIVIGLAGVGVVVGPVLFRNAFSVNAGMFASRDRIDVSMTQEERLADLEYLYDMAYLSNQNKEEFEKLYGMDFEKQYETYQEYVKECESDYEFYCICFSFLRDMPSGHTNMQLPVYDSLAGCGFESEVECALKKDESKYLYSWARVLEEGIKDYDLENMKFTNFSYVGGSYFGGSLCESDIKGARIITINGMLPEEYVAEGMYFSKREYDDLNNIIYRTSLYFNDRYGMPVDIVCETVEGEEITLQVYADYTAEIAFLLDYNLKSVDPDYGNKPQNEEDATTEEESEESNSDSKVHKGATYEIVEDDEHGVLYWRVEDCEDLDAGNEMKEIVQGIINNYDKVILDLRDNRGGKEIFYKEYIYPVLFKDDEKVEPFKVEMQINDITRNWAKNTSNKFIANAKIDKQSEIITYEENGYKLKGNGVKDYDVYALIDEGTFSSGDIIAYNLSTHDNVTLVGTHTGGEGIDGSIFVGMLPNSRLTFTFCPGINRSITPSNAVYGTAPDVESNQSEELYQEKVKHIVAGEDMTTYESRKLWDNMLWDAWKLCEE